MSTNPPAIALWLLGRLVGGPSREALLGDLVEQHARGRSNAWFWKEALAAIGASVAAETRARYGVISAVAFFVGFTAAALLGTVKTLPGFAPVDASLAAFAAGWLVCRFGGFSAALAFAAFVSVREVPLLYEPLMSFFDHFGGLWLITHHGMTALPASLAWAALCIVAGAVCSARPRDGESAPSTAAR
jgi:hypothetical protein